MQANIDSCYFNISDFLFRSSFRAPSGGKVGYQIFVPDSFSRANDNEMVILDNTTEASEVEQWMQRDCIVVVPDDASDIERAEFEQWLKFAFAAHLIDTSEKVSTAA